MAEDETEQRPKTLSLVKYPADALREATRHVGKVDAWTAVQFQLMFDVMKEHSGVGIAAQQVGFRDRVCICQMGRRTIYMVNPKITAAFGGTAGNEGCLSMPGLVGAVRRPTLVMCEWKDVNGKTCRETFKGAFARIVQHEVDHLDGILWVDRAIAQNSKEIEAIHEALEALGGVA